jgi:CheY-like chemotaxis protein
MKRILLIDDSPMALSMLSDALVDRYEVVTAASGEEAIEILETDAADADKSIKIKQFSVIVTDLRMPGMSGLDVADRVKQMNRYHRFTPVLLLTGEEITKEEARAHGCASLVSKENSERIVSMIHILLGGEEARSATVIRKREEDKKVN